MKKTLIATIMIVLVAAGTAVCGLNYIVRTPSGVFLVTKNNPGYRHIYLDTSAWGVTDYFVFPEIKDAVISGDLPEHDDMRAKIIFAENTAETVRKVEAAVGEAREKLGASSEMVAEKGQALRQQAAVSLNNIFPQK